MEKTNFCILLFVIFLTSLCNSQDYRYDDYNYDEYDYNDQQPEDYTDDYSQESNDYYDQNLLPPPNPPLPPPIPPPITPPPPMAPMGKMTFFSSILNTTCKGAATQLFSRPLCFLVIELLKAIACFN